ncbi:uncharacterized protein LOC107493321 [Arachis duranensis]|uniref:Uncharacterized protein LOC107493321 n=1 Tax=Arachis duranensis TaxID=130453 RepID=A0A6P4DKP9_ARADU|nr:uncharacterized protein LOC107493321 [Arachis duranensis]
MSGFVPFVRFESVNGVNNSQNPQQHYEFSCDYNVGSTSNASNSLAVFRQHVEESHHDLVNLLTQQMTTILNPMMADHKLKFECLTRQVEWIARIVDYDEGERHDVRGNNERFKNLFQNENNVLNRENPQIILYGQNADDVLARLRANYGGERYQVIRIVKEVLNRVGLNVGFINRPHFVSAFSQVVQMAEVPRGLKNPKIITKFAGKVRESTTEHVTRYLVEIGNLTNDENLKMMFFPSSLTKNAFTWFSNLRPNLITTWNQLKTAFHAQFYRGELNVAITDLVALKREDGETIVDYMIHLKHARSRCYVSLPENEVVKIAVMG